MRNSFKKISVKQQSKKWFQLRAGTITASMLGAVMGVHPFVTRDEYIKRLVRERLGLKINHKEMTNQQLKGIVMEPWAARDVQGILELQNERYHVSMSSGALYLNEGVFAATPDYEIIIYEYDIDEEFKKKKIVHEKLLLEIKTRCGNMFKKDDRAISFNSIFSEKLRHDYYQIQGQLCAAGLDRCLYYQNEGEESRLECVVFDLKLWIEIEKEINNIYFLEYSQPLDYYVDKEYITKEEMLALEA